MSNQFIRRNINPTFWLAEKGYSIEVISGNDGRIMDPNEIPQDTIIRLCAECFARPMADNNPMMTCDRCMRKRMNPDRFVKVEIKADPNEPKGKPMPLLRGERTPL